MIWISLLIPIAVAIYLAKYHERSMAWWEFLVGIVPTIIIICICKYSTEWAITRDVEVWGNLLTQATYYEDWDEEVPCSHPRYCKSYSTDSDGKQVETEYQCGYEHAYDVDYHPAYWEGIDNQNNVHSMSDDLYKELCIRWGNKQVFTDLHRDYHSNDGDKWSILWDNSYNTHEFIATSHTWVNKVAKTENAMRLPHVSSDQIQQYHLFEYPRLSGWNKMPGILADSGISIPEEAQKRLNWLNGTLGSTKEVRVWILIFNNQSSDAAYYQECLWQRGKQNEFTVCVSLDTDKKVKWAKVFSWTDEEILKIETRDYLQNLDTTFNVMQLIDTLHTSVAKKFIRKDFKQFDYLTVETPMWMVIVTFILTAFVNVMLAVWCLKNQFTKETPHGY